MKAFLEEYGLVIVIVLVVTMLIAVAAYVSKNGKKSLQDTYGAFADIANDAVGNAISDYNTNNGGSIDSPDLTPDGSKE